MELTKDKILKVQKERGRGNKNIHVFARSANHEWVIPAIDGREDYQIVLDWVAEGNEILEPPPKDIDPNRGPLAYRDYRECSVPEDDNNSVWRYMDFTKFVALLENSALFFSRGSVITNEDAFEGSFPENSKSPVFEMLSAEYKKNPNKFNLNFLLGMIPGKEWFRDMFKNEVLINCWCRDEHENHLMWAGYGKGESSIAVKSDLGLLKKSFGDYSDYDIYIGKISYIDYSLEEVEINPMDRIVPYLYKRVNFKSENEIRCFLVDDGDINLFPEDEPRPFEVGNGLMLNPGINVPVDLNLLIREIRVAPKAPIWLPDLIKSLLKRYNLSEKPVLLSDLAAKPKS